MKTLLQKAIMLILSGCLSLQLASQNDFTIIAIPDTQHYTDVEENEEIFAAQTQWIVDNKDNLNIVFVTGLGDITQNGNDDDEWQIADAAYDLIEDPITTMLTDGIPFGLSVGNHDQFPFGDPDPPSTTKFNEYFGTARFTGRGYYGGHYGSDNDNSYQLISASGLDFIFIHFEYDTSPEQAVLDWADNLLATHSNRRAIISTHYMIGNGNPANWSSQGQAIYNALSDNENLFLMLGGHVSSEGMREDTGPNNNVIYSLLSDYQDLPNGGNGWLRIMEFSPANNEITVSTYSPWLDEYGTDTEMDGNSTSAPFTLAYDMGGNPPPSVELQDGLNGYDGTRDTYLYDVNPTTVRGGENTFIQDKNPGDDRTSLLLFDLSSIPAGSTINSAELEFYVDTEGQGFNMHRMLQPWDEATISFSSNGGHFAPDGTDAEVVVDANWPGNDGYTGFITVTVPAATIQDWIDGNLTNNGWLMIATHASDGQQLRSREYITQAHRPKLTVDYTPPPSPTITVNGTPLIDFSSAPGIPSLEQSYTVSGSNLTANIAIAAPTDFEVSTTSGSGFGPNLILTQSGGSVPSTTIYVRFNRATTGISSGDIVHTSTGATTENVAVSGVACASTVETEIFQDGTNSYSGTRDTYLWDFNPSTIRGSESTFIQDINNSDERRSLLSFDLTSIPLTSTILSGELEFNVDTEGQGFNMHRMLKPWNEATITYTSNGGHFDPDGTDAEVTVDANWPGDDEYTGLITVPVQATSIQDWVDGTLINDGWLMIATHGSDGQQLTSREGPQSLRPKLTLQVCPNAPLPVELTDFQVKKDGENSFIYWETSSEFNNNGFEIQKSQDGLRWQKLYWVEGQGTTNTPQYYSFIDTEPYQGLNYYRLRQIDFDGSESLSTIRVVNFEAKLEKAFIFPNPVHTQLTVNLPEKVDGKISFEIRDASGKVLFFEEIALNDTVFKINTNNLVSGIYYLNIQSESFDGSYPFVKSD